MSNSIKKLKRDRKMVTRSLKFGFSLISYPFPCLTKLFHEWPFIFSRKIHQKHVKCSLPIFFQIPENQNVALHTTEMKITDIERQMEL